MMGGGPNTGMGQHGLHHNQNMMNSFDHPGAHKDEFRKVKFLWRLVLIII